MGKDMRPFFVMPGSALKDLREELLLINGTDSARTMERYGFRAGVGLVKTLGLECGDIAEARAIIDQVWTETGLSRMNIEIINETEIVITFKESVEADNGDHCDFTRGYLGGIISSLMKRRYDAFEASCISDGAAKCVHVFTPSPTYHLEGRGSVKAEEERERKYLPRIGDLLSGGGGHARLRLPDVHRPGERRLHRNGVGPGIPGEGTADIWHQ